MIGVVDFGIVVVIFLLVWVGAAVIIDVFIGVGCRRGRRPDLASRLRPHQPSIADEAEGWLNRQG